MGTGGDFRRPRVGSMPDAGRVTMASTGRRNRKAKARGVDAVYDELAPLAVAQGTLIPATEYEFRELCDLVVMHRQTRERLRRMRTVDAKWHQLQRTFDMLTRRLETKLRSFCLAPMGRALVEPPAAAQTPLDVLRGRRRAG